ncbi:phospho-sugar mutase [Galactobacillus timonensis]|uniref:phospho-sugar mutase n=1 Tax=Galactobacillus timonensis TaxID=2041840 RepID=UPI000C840528|nr:phospho-sugar mutase [Galactobacillus timonensis]
MNHKIDELYRLWLKKADRDPDLQKELSAIENYEDAIEDAFYQDLKFGTGGLRGIIGAGTNRMNVYTVAKATQGLANGLKKTAASPSVAISYDSRRKSKLFAQTAAEVLCANGIRVYLYPQLMPTPCLSYAVRYFHTSAGIMITASHNPAEYNGYKVYGADGCQITTEAASRILKEIEQLDPFEDILSSSYEEDLSSGKIQLIDEAVLSCFLDTVSQQSQLFGDDADRSLSIVYTPLNGTGRVPVLKILEKQGFHNVSVVPEQEMPDEDFPTCPYPNPELDEALTLGKQLAEKKHADLLIATDPDCDRVGVMARDGGALLRLSGNEVGLLLLDYICQQKSRHHTMPADPVLIKTIVTSDLAEKIAQSFGVRTINVLTGFKYIGEQIGLLENSGKAASYVFGFEESCGYLNGTYVRDKDGVDGVMLITETAAYWKAHGKTLVQRLNEIYGTYGYMLNTLHSFSFPGEKGMQEMDGIMDRLRGPVQEIAGMNILERKDYSNGIDGLPKSNVMKFSFNGGSLVIRPSGTEPKLKIYASILDEDKEKAEAVEKKLIGAFKTEYIQ